MIAIARWGELLRTHNFSFWMRVRSTALTVHPAGIAVDIVLLFPDRQPKLYLVTTEHLTNLVNAWAESPQTIVASAFEDTLGPPIVFPKSDFDALMQLSGDRGARPIIDANKERVQAITCEEAAFDIDRPEDLAGIY